VSEEGVTGGSSADPTAARPERGLSRHLCWVLCSLTLLAVFPYYEQINNPNENARIWMTRAIVDHHELQINRVGLEWGYVNDKAVVSGRLYSGKTPGTSFVGVPIYFAARQVARLAGVAPMSKRALTLVLRLFGVTLPMIVFLYFFARWVELATGSAQARDLLVVGLGLGTMLYPYGVIFVGHALAAALAFSGFMLLEREPKGAARPGRLAWAGALVGASVVFEYQVLFAAIALTGYAIARHRRGVLFFALGALPLAVALGAYHTVLFGRPWETSLNHLENPTFASWHNNARFLGFQLPSVQAFMTVLFSPSLGLFVFSSFLLAGLAAAAWLPARRRLAEGLTILAITAAMVFFLTGVPNWHAGWCVGPRYIAVVPPFLAGAVALAWRHAKGRFGLSLLVTGLVIPSVFLNVISGAVYPHYPEVFDNPVFDLTLPLIADGYRPYGLGWLLGLPRAWAMLPVALFAALALIRVLRGPDRLPSRRAIHAAGALVIAALVLVPLSRYGRTPSPGEATSASFVRSTWAPRP
jgi:hypothetical protein